MRNYIQHVKEKLLESIQSLESQKEMFVLHQDKDFSRNRKLPFETMIKLILEMAGNTLDHELRHYLHLFSARCLSVFLSYNKKEKMIISSMFHLLLVLLCFCRPLN